MPISLSASPAAAELPEDLDWLNVLDIKVQGNKRTDTATILSYINFQHIPLKINHKDLGKARLKLLSTGLFSDVSFKEECGDVEPKNCHLTLVLAEKWTLIPVVRGEYGGGVPMKVAGAYNTNFLGKMYTAGGEFVQYGEEPWGGYLWFKAPYFAQGRYDLGFEISHLNRLRPYPIISDEVLAGEKKFTTLHEKSLKTYFHWPLFASQFSPENLQSLRIGLDLQFRSQIVHAHGSHRKKQGDNKEIMFLPLIIYNSITAINSDYEGSRLILRGGPILRFPVVSYYDAEYFTYRFIAHYINLSGHFWVGQYNSAYLLHKFYLGGLDSVRGFPDAYLSGSKAAYTNIEARDVRFKYGKYWWQIVTFFDAGLAGETWAEAGPKSIYSIGAGFRVSMPQIYRLMLRADYAVNLRDPKMSSVSIGLNQFFQPNRPR